MMTETPTYPIDDHGLTQVLAEVRSTASAAPQDLSRLTEAPHLFEGPIYDRVRVVGRDRVRFLHAMLSNDISSLSEGEGRWATFNSVQGKTIADVRVLVLDEAKKTGDALALLEPGAAERFITELDRFIIADKCYFEEDEGMGFFLLAGHGAASWLEAAGASLPPQGPFNHCKTQLGGVDVQLIRLDRTSIEGEDIGLRFALEDEDEVREALSGLATGSPELLEAARLAGGQPRFGIDFTSENIPLEAGLKDLAISFTKGCYIGQEVICRIDSMGSPKRRLARLEQLPQVPNPGALLFGKGKEVGWVTSVAATTEGPLAFGYVKKRFREPGTELQLGSPEGATIAVGAPVGNV